MVLFCFVGLGEEHDRLHLRWGKTGCPAYQSYFLFDNKKHQQSQYFYIQQYSIFLIFYVNLFVIIQILLRAQRVLMYFFGVGTRVRSEVPVTLFYCTTKLIYSSYILLSMHLVKTYKDIRRVNSCNRFIQKLITYEEDYNSPKGLTFLSIA